MTNSSGEAAPGHEGNGRPSWFEQAGNVRRIVWALYAVCAALVVIDVAIHKHGPFAIEHTFAFYAWYGFVACVALVLVAKVMRIILMRPENYYDR